VNEPINGKQK